METRVIEIHIEVRVPEDVETSELVEAIEDTLDFYAAWTPAIDVIEDVE